jgi:hypothetical protein
MKFLDRSNDYDEIGRNWRAYRAYLESIRSQLPSRVFDFATGEWHYDPRDHRSLHDSWVKFVEIRETTIDNGRDRMPSIVVGLLGPYHDGETTLSYRGVVSYELALSRRTSSDPTTLAHGDLLVDEIGLSVEGNVTHELLFASGARWVVECSDIEYSTTIPAIREP